MPPLECSGSPVAGRFPKIAAGDSLLFDAKHLFDITIYLRSALRCDGIRGRPEIPGYDPAGVLIGGSHRGQQSNSCQPVRLLPSDREADCFADEIIRPGIGKQRNNRSGIVQTKISHQLTNIARLFQQNHSSPCVPIVQLYRPFQQQISSFLSRSPRHPGKVVSADSPAFREIFPIHILGKNDSTSRPAIPLRRVFSLHGIRAAFLGFVDPTYRVTIVSAKPIFTAKSEAPTAAKECAPGGQLTVKVSPGRRVLRRKDLGSKKVGPCTFMRLARTSMRVRCTRTRFDHILKPFIRHLQDRSSVHGGGAK